jgi:hypothetical protein
MSHSKKDGKARVDSDDMGDSNDNLIIAFDFGTTFSGVAYSFANQRDAKVVAIMSWPGTQLCWLITTEEVGSNSKVWQELRENRHPRSPH